MMSTIRELLKDAMKDESKVLVYAIRHFLSAGKLKYDDPADKFDEVIANATDRDNQAIGELMEQNPLGIDEIHVYAMKIEKGRFAFVFARDEEEATYFFCRTFQRWPMNCHQYPMDSPMSVGYRFRSFRELKKEHDEFPALAGIYEKEVTA